MKRIIHVFLVFYTLFFYKNTYGDTLYFKNGTKVNGKILTQSQKFIKIKIKGKVKKVHKSEIKAISYDAKNKLYRKKNPQKALNISNSPRNEDKIFVFSFARQRFSLEQTVPSGSSITAQIS